MTTRPKTSEIVDPPNAFALICGSISFVLLAFLFVWHALPPVLNHVRDVSSALSPVLTFLTVVVVVVGWGETARRTGEEARRTARVAGEEARNTEAAKQEQLRQGTRRQVRTLLRDTLATIRPFSYLGASIDLEDILVTYGRLVDRLNMRETSVDLLDAEYYAIDSVVDQLRKMIALAQRHADRYPEPPSFTGLVESVQQRHERERQRVFDYRRYFRAAWFTLHLSPHLYAAIDLFGDDLMRQDLAQTVKRGQQTIDALANRLAIEDGLDDI